MPPGRSGNRGWQPAGVTDPFDLQRFLDAQAHTYDQALAELRAGEKRTHWMWFVFPQLAGLGLSELSKRYAISSLEEARRYLAHPVLGRRLVESARALTTLDTDDPAAVLGSVDAIKLRSSMTLFAHAAPANELFRAVIDRYFDGTADGSTEARLDL